MSDTPRPQPQDPVLEMAGGSAGTSFTVRARRDRFDVSERQRTLIAVACAAIGFAISWYLIHHGWYRLDRQWDTREYAKYARNIVVRGWMPYRDFSVEYPPLALPIFLIPRLIAGNSFSVEYPPLALPIFLIPRLIAGNSFSGYMEAFELMMALCGVIATGLATLVLAAQRVSTRQLVCGVALLALSPLLLGAVVLSRYDLFPTMLTIGALTAIYFDWSRTGFALLALGTAAKAFPIVILPIAAVYIWRRQGRRAALICLAVFAVVLAVCLVPFLVIAPHGLWWAIHGQENRPLQLESVGAALFLAAHQLVGLHLSYYFTHSSDNLDGHVPMAFAGVMSVLQLLALVAVWALYALGSATRERLLVLAAAAVCAFIVFDRVLSPQYLIWLAPLVATINGRRGLVAMALLASAMAVTQIYYPLHFAPLKSFAALESWTVIGRDLLLVTLFAALAWPDGSVALRRVSVPWARQATAG